MPVMLKTFNTTVIDCQKVNYYKKVNRSINRNTKGFATYKVLELYILCSLLNHLVFFENNPYFALKRNIRRVNHVSYPNSLWY